METASKWPFYRSNHSDVDMAWMKISQAIRFEA